MAQPGPWASGENARECSEGVSLDPERVAWKGIVYRPDWNWVVKMEPVFSRNVRKLPILSLPSFLFLGFCPPLGNSHLGSLEERSLSGRKRGSTPSCPPPRAFYLHITFGVGDGTTFKGQCEEAIKSSLMLREMGGDSTTGQSKGFGKPHISGSQSRQRSFGPTNQASFGEKWGAGQREEMDK